MNEFSIVGLYGVKNEHLIEPTDPDCQLVVIFYDESNNKCIYHTKDDCFYGIDFDDSITTQLFKDYDDYKKEIKEYLNSDKIIISKQEKYAIPDFTRMALPFIRRVYPTTIANSLVSVQPMSAPASLGSHLRKQKDEQEE